MNRKLPVLTEHSLSSVMSSRLAVADAFEREIIKEADTSGKPLSCHSGCDSCCYHPVFLTVTEGILLYRHLVSAGKWSPTFKKSLEAHADMVRELDFPVWLLSMVACPLLDKNSRKCTVYDARPFQCRVTYSLGDAYNCHPHRILNSGIVSRAKTTEEFHSLISKATKKHGITMISMPLSVAILIGEQIVSGAVDLENADMAILKDYLE